MRDFEIIPIPVPRWENAKIVRAETPHDFYLRFGRDVPRGDPGYVQSSGELSELIKCPEKWVKGGKVQPDETEAMRIGTGLDVLDTMPGSCEDRLAVAPEDYTNEKGETKPWNWNAKVCKAWKADHAGKTILKAKEFDKCNAMFRAVRAARERWGLAQVWAEAASQVMVTADYLATVDGEKVMVPIRILIDKVPKTGGPLAGWLLDLKTCSDGHPLVWQTQTFGMGYHVQAGLYLDVWNAASGESRDTFGHILVENEAPHQCGRRIVSQQFLALGRIHYVRALDLYARSMVTHEWPDWEQMTENVNGWGLTEPKEWMAR